MLHVFLHVKWPRSISFPRFFQHLWPEITTFFQSPHRGLCRCLAHGIGTRTLRQRSQDVALDLSGLRLGPHGTMRGIASGYVNSLLLEMAIEIVDFPNKHGDLM